MMDPHAEDYVASSHHVVRQRALSVDSASRLPNSSFHALARIPAFGDNDQMGSIRQMAPCSPRLPQNGSSQFDPPGTRTPDSCSSPRFIRQVDVESLLSSPERVYVYNKQMKQPEIEPPQQCITPAPVERNLSRNFDLAGDSSRPHSALSFDRPSSPVSVQSFEPMPMGQMMICVPGFPVVYSCPPSPMSSSDHYYGSDLSWNWQHPDSVHDAASCVSPIVCHSPAPVTPLPQIQPFRISSQLEIALETPTPPEETSKPSGYKDLPEISQRRLEDSTICHWIVHARVLTSTDTKAISKIFELLDREGKLMGRYQLGLTPKACYIKKGGSSFKKAKGKGFIYLKAMDRPQAPANLTFGLHVGSRLEERCTTDPSGPYVHDFSEKDMWELKDREWDFGDCVDDKTQRFIVSLLVAFPDA